MHSAHCTVYEQTFITLVTAKALLQRSPQSEHNPFSFCHIIFHVRICVSILEIYERFFNTCTGPPHAPNACFHFSAPCVRASVLSQESLLCKCTATDPPPPPHLWHHMKPPFGLICSAGESCPYFFYLWLQTRSILTAETTPHTDLIFSLVPLQYPPPPPLTFCPRLPLSVLKK